MTPTASFNVLDRPWIPVMTRSGDIDEVSLRDLFVRSGELRSVVAELGTQNVAIYRLALAVLHRALDESGPDDEMERWKELWTADDLPQKPITQYLDSWADRFDLLHPEMPFYQVAGLHTKTGKTSGLKAFIADVPNGHEYFTMRAGPSLARMSFAEAARWLVHCHAFDLSGIKSGAVGDPRVTGGKGYPIGTGWAGLLGIVLPEGRSLRETLLLNLVLTRRGGDSAADPSRLAEAPGRPDLPPWEREPLGPGVDEDRPDGEPFGPVDLLTWQSRRILLTHDGEKVTDVLVANGDPLRPQNRFPLERMTEWRRSEPQEKKLKRNLVYMPAKFVPSRSFWRGLESSLPSPEARLRSSGREPASRLPASVLTCIQALRADEVIPDGFPLRIHAVAMIYGSNDSVVDEIVDDVLVLHTDVLSNDVLRTQAIDAVREAEQAVAALAHLAGNLALASGGEADGARDRAREQGFFALDAPYRRWAAAITPTTEMASHRLSWRDVVRRTVRASAHALIQAAGPPAYVGRTITIKNKPVRIDVGVASGWFDAALAKALPQDPAARP